MIYKNNFIRENLSDIKDGYNDINKILQKEKGISLEFIDELTAHKHG